MANLKAVLDSLDGVDESLHGFYKAGDDGKFVLNVTGIDQMPAVAGLKAKNTELLDEKKTVQEQLKAFGDVTPDDIAELRKKAEGKGSNTDAAKRVTELETQLEEVKKNAKAEVEKAQTEAASARDSYVNSFLDSEIVEALARKEVDGSPVLLKSVMRGRMTAKEVNGKLVPVVLGEDGKTERIKDSQGNPMTAVDLALELKEDPQYGRAFAPSGNSGSGADSNPTGGGGSGGAKTSFDRNDPLAWGQNAEGVAKGEAAAK